MASLTLVILMLSRLLLANALSAATTASPAHSPSVLARDSQVCGGDSSLSQCGDSFPSDFCCPASTQCLLLDTTDAIATLCCPEGQTCNFVTPIKCDLSAQNATTFPGSGYHSDPTMQLNSCGSGCCPAGAQCRNGACQVFAASSSGLSSTPSTTIAVPSSPSGTTSTPTTSASSAAVTTATSDATSTPAPAAIGVNSSDSTGAVTVNHSFSGSSFAAGFIPGIVIGIIIIVCILWCLTQRRKARAAWGDEKYQHSNDQLTDLSTDSTTHDHRPSMHQRSISEPIADPSNGHRTDFSRSTPPRFPDPAHTDLGYTATITGPTPPAPARTPKIKALFARSPIFPTSSSPRTPPTDPLPSHLKRGTLSHAYTISPIRALRTKKSSHSLRRQMTSATAPSQVSRASSRRHPRQQRPDVSRENSTGTIQVLMPSMEPYTPDQRTQQPTTGKQAPSSVPPATSHPPSMLLGCYNTQPISAPPQQQGQAQQHHYAPASLYSLYSNSPPRTAQPEMPSLGTPYTPTRAPGASATNINMNVSPVWGKGKGKVTGVLLQPDGGLTVERAPGDHDRRQTTFSGFMERAGIGKEHFVGGGGR